MRHEIKEGRGPIYMDTPTMLAKLAETMILKDIKHLESRPGKTFSTCVSVRLAFGPTRTLSERKKAFRADVMPPESYLLGSHSGRSGIWVRGPEDLGAPDDWHWGYRSMTLVQSLFTAVMAWAPPAASSPPARMPKVLGHEGRGEIHARQ